jgi:ribosomal protein S18 acetylase RimI-like enzyme
VWTRDGDTHIVGMYVAPEARGLGCAHQLLDLLADLAIRRRGKRLVLEVAESNVVPAVATTRMAFSRPVAGG